MAKTLPFLLGKALFAHEKKTAGGGMRQQWRKALEQALLEKKQTEQRHMADTDKTSKAGQPQYQNRFSDKDTENGSRHYAGGNQDIQTARSAAVFSAMAKAADVNQLYCAQTGLDAEMILTAAIKENKLSLAGPGGKQHNESSVAQRVSREFHEHFPSLKNAVLLRMANGNNAEDSGWHLTIRDTGLQAADIRQFVQRLRNFFKRLSLKLIKLTINGESITFSESDLKNNDGNGCSTSERTHLINKTY